MTIRATHRIYMQQGMMGRLAQVPEPTSIFYDVDADTPLQENDTTWLPITQAGRGRAWEILFERVPNGTEDNIVIDDLGAPMKLIKNRWYVDARHVDLDRAEKLPQVVRLTCLQWFTVGTIIVGLVLVMVMDESRPTVALISLILAVLFMAADYLIQRRFWC
jgi:hypothetical protein